MKELLNLINDEFDRYITNFSTESTYYLQLNELKKDVIYSIKMKENSFREFLLQDNLKKRYLRYGRYSTIANIIIYNTGSFDLIIKINDKYTYKKEDNFLKKIFNYDHGFIYLANSLHGWKIGKTKDLKRREKEFGIKLPFKIYFKYYIRTNGKDALEKELHDFFNEKNIDGEWFNLENKDFENLKSYLKSRKLKLSKYSI